ncbi:hypothetical protein ABXS75_10890 [Roseburia hominis]
MEKNSGGLWQKIRRDDTWYLKVFLIFFVIGNVFFLTSNQVFRGTPSMIEITEFNSDLSWNDRTIQMKRWDYDPENSLMEVELSIDKNESLDGIRNYSYAASEYNEGAMKVEAVAETEDMLVIQIKEIPKRYTVVALHVSVPGEGEGTDLAVYGDRNSITQKSIHTKTTDEYEAEKIEREIGELEKLIRLEEDKIEQEEKTVENGIARVRELRAKKDYQTEEEQSKTQSQISEIESRIEASRSEVRKGEENVREYQARIEKETELLSKYEGGIGHE